MAQYSTKFVKTVPIAKDVFEIHLEKPAGFAFTAGQFIQFRIPEGDKIWLRSYSMASAPHEEVLVFCAKVYPTGKASARFQAANPGDVIEFQGPVGRFVSAAPTPLVLIATGAGLAPIMSIIRDELFVKKNPERIHLLFGVRKQEDVFWKQELEALQAQFPHFSFDLTLSQPESEWGGKQGRVTAHLVDAINANAHYFLCGNLEMVKEVKQLLIERLIPAGNIHFEIF